METKLMGMGWASRPWGMAFLVLLISVTVSTMAWAGPQPLVAGGTVTGSTPPTDTVYNPTGSAGLSFDYPGTDLTLVPAYTVSGSFQSPAPNITTGDGWSEVVATDSRTGDLDFFIQITLGTGTPSNPSTVVAAFSELAGENYNYAASVGDDVSGGPTGNTGTDASTSISRNGAGTTIDFTNFTNGNGTTYYLGIFTNAPDATAGNLNVSGGTGPGEFTEGTDDIFVPAPEPMTIVFGLAIACVIGAQVVRKGRGAFTVPAGKTFSPAV